MKDLYEIMDVIKDKPSGWIDAETYCQSNTEAIDWYMMSIIKEHKVGRTILSRKKAINGQPPNKFVSMTIESSN